MGKKMNKYDREHLKNLTAIERQIEKIFEAAVREAARLGVRIDKISPDRLFSFDDYPITRKEVESLLERLKTELTTAIVNGVRSAWTLSNNKNDELCHQVYGDNIGKLSQAQYRRYFSTNGQALDAFLKRKQNGLNLSDRVWRYSDAFKNEIELGLDVGIRNGLSADEMSRELRKWLRHPDMLFRRVRDEHGNLQLSKRAAAFHPGQGVYRSSYKNARRLAATETNIAYRTADFERWQQFDFVVGIEIVLSNNHTLLGADGLPHPFTDICDELAGKYPKDFKFTGWHPHCRCHAVSILKSEEEMAEDNRRILSGEEPLTESANTVRDVPEGFKNWLKDNEERVKFASSVPYFISDNAKRYVPESFINSVGTLKGGASALKAISMKEALLKIKDPTYITDKEVKTAIMDFSTANPSLFNGGLAAVKITRARGVNAFMANARVYDAATGTRLIHKGNTITITANDIALGNGTVFNPLHEVKGAMKAIAENKAFTFNQEYALESLWHEIRHASAVGWKDLRRKNPSLTGSMELINQFCARMSYSGFVRSLGGKATHTRKVLEKGYGYGRSVENFCYLLKQMRVSQKKAYNHFSELIIKTPYEDVQAKLVEFVETFGKYDRKKAETIVSGLDFLPDSFKALL